MRDPRRWRNIALVFFVSGIVVTPIAFLLPAAVMDNSARGLLTMYGLMALIFGGVSAWSNHAASLAKESLARGKDIIARWRVDAATWREFVTHIDKLDQEFRFLYIGLRAEAPAGGIEVIVGNEAVEIDGDVYELPRRDPPTITHAALNTSRVRPSFIELHLYYPGGGSGAGGLFSPKHMVLRFAVVADALREAARVVAHFREDLRMIE